MKASKKKATKEDLKSNLLGGRERVEGGDPGPETLSLDIETPASRFLRSKAGGSQQTSRRGRGRGRGMAQVNRRFEEHSNNADRGRDLGR